MADFDKENPHLAARADAVVALARLQSERREALETLICSEEKGVRLHMLITALQAQNDIERLMLLICIDALAHTDEKLGVKVENFFQPGPTALDALAQAKPDSTDYDWTDAGYILGPIYDGLKGDVMGPEMIPDVGPRGVFFIELGANRIRSGSVSAIGCELRQFEGQQRARIYVRFKGGALYRYWPFKRGVGPGIPWMDMLNIVRDMRIAAPTPLSVGEYVERVLKAAHNMGLVECQGLSSDGVWVQAMTADELARTKAERKAKREGQQAAVRIIREIAQASANPDEGHEPHPDSPVARKDDPPLPDF